ncbi:MAG: hypothetical protein GC162_19685 [Planctomycetes bacterium]|nr:hypothetical protein [Planctomycetota bacterium]
MLTLAMILDNPGEQPHQTRYRDPRLLRQLGYSDIIIYPTTGLSGLLGPQTLSSNDLRQWVTEQYDGVQKTVDDAKAAGLGVWLIYDAPSLAEELVGSAMTCINHRPPMLCPASDELLEMSGECLDALVGRLDPVDGIVLRLGDNDAAKVPYLIGNDIYSPHCSRCSNMGRADRLVRFINYFYGLVVGKLNRKLIVRAWNVRPGGMHDNAELCGRVVEQLPKDDRLILSFKFTQTDFWRYQQWNPSSLVCGDRPIIYELQCQREFEAKGAVPNYQPPLWRDGMEEVADAMGLATVSDKVNLAGLWAWVRGGGWRGPYIGMDKEVWIDANVVAVPKLAADPKAPSDALARSWVRERLGIEDEATAESILQVLRDSPRNVLEMFYIAPYARSRKDPWHPSAHFIQDDQIDAEAAWTIIQRLGDRELDDLVNEKKAAEQRLAEDSRAIARIAPRLSEPLGSVLPLSLEYAHTLAQTLTALLTGLVAYRRYLRRPDPTLAKQAVANMQECQKRWLHHTQSVSSHRSAPTPFASDTLFDVTQRVLDHLMAQEIA